MLHLLALKWWFWLPIDYRKGSNRLYWQDPKEVNGTKIKFTGVPFYIMGCKIFDCQRGKDRKCCPKKKAKPATWAGVCTIYYKISITGFKHLTLCSYFKTCTNLTVLSLCKKSRFLAQPSKKANCPARLKLREVIAFPQYKVFNFLNYMQNDNS